MTGANGSGGAGRLLAVSDLHVSNPESREVVERFAPEGEADWLIVCGDISESLAECEWALALLSGRFAKVIWTPGNHDLWTLPREQPDLRGERRYRHLVDICRRFGVLTPEDPFPIWEGDGGPVTVAPLFVLYDYSFGRNVAPTKAAALARAEAAGVVCSDEFLLHPDPYPSREAWCRARVELTESRLEGAHPELPTVLVNHFPLVVESTRALWYQEFAQWCGTDLTADWHRRFKATAVVYGHLHIPRTTWHDGVRFEEVSLGYPREWARRRSSRPLPRRILPFPEAT